MRITKHYHWLILTLFLSFLPFLGCESEKFNESEIIENITLLDEFKLNFSLEQFDDPSGHIVDNVEIDWNDFETKTFNGKEWYEFQVFQNKPIFYDGKGELQGQFFTLLVHKNNKEIKYFVNKMLSFSDGNSFTYFNIQKDYYHGMVYLYNLKGEAEHLLHFEKGKIMHGIESIKIETSNTDNLGLIARGDCWEKGNTSRCDSALQCALDGGANTGGSCGGGGTSGGTGWTAITTFHFTEWYNNNGDSWSYNGYTYDGQTVEWVWIPGDGYGQSESSWSYAETSNGNPNPDGYSTGEVNFFNNPPTDEKVDKNVLLIIPPDCESFEFEKVGNNQFSYVKGIRFLVVDSDGKKHYLLYENAMEFSAPHTDRFGVVYSAGALAEASAKALKEAMDNTAKHILDLNYYLGEYRAKRYFEDELKRVYPLYIPGGRVQPRPNSQHVSNITDYKAKWFGTGNCD